MTKKLLLTAAALGAMAFAGAAAAGELSIASKIGNEALVASGELAPYVVAKDFAFTAAAGLKTNNAPAAGGNPAALDRTQFVFDNTTNPISVASNTDYVVTLSLTGPAKFIDQGQTAVDLGGNTATVTPIVSADGKTLTIYAKTPAGSTGVLDTITVGGFNLHVTGQDSVSVAYKLQQVVGSQTLDLDSSSAAEVIAFKNALTVYSGETKSVLAALPNFMTFKGITGALTSNNFTSTSKTAYRTDLTGAASAVPAISSIVTGYTATVTGPQIEDMLTSFGGQAITAATDVTAGSATFAKTGSADVFNLVLTPKTDTAIEEGRYKVSIAPIYAPGWSGPASLDRTVVVVGLDGTNFFAPWFALDNGSANSTLRIANNGSAAIGPVIVTLKANNGSAAPTGTHVIPSVAAGSFVSVRGDQLKTAFGTDAANGDLMVTVQSQTNSVSAKVRTTQSTGQIYENTLGVLPQVQ